MPKVVQVGEFQLTDLTGFLVFIILLCILNYSRRKRVFLYLT